MALGTKATTAVELQSLLQDRMKKPKVEREMLSRMMNGNVETRVLLIDRLHTELFTDQYNGLLFNYMSELYVSGKEITQFSVLTEIQMRAKALQYQFLGDRLNEVTGLADYTLGIESGIVELERSYQTRLMENEIFTKARKMFVDNEDFDKVLSIISNTILKTETGPKPVSVKDAARQVLDMALNPKASDMGKLTGLEDWDIQFGGVKKRKVITIAGYTGSGKTAMIIHLICALCMKYPDEVAIQFFSLEMPEIDVMIRIYSWLTSITEHQMANQKPKDGSAGTEVARALTDTQRNKLIEAFGIVQDWPLEIVYQTMDAKTLERKGKQFALKNRGKHIIQIIDHIGEAAEGGNPKDMRHEFNAIMSVCQKWKREHDATAIPLIQLSKETEKGKDQEKVYNRPNAGFIMESVGVEAKSDVLGMLWRPGKEARWKEIKYNGMTLDVSNLIFFIVQKNRGGKRGNDIIFRSKIQYNQLFNQRAF